MIATAPHLHRMPATRDLMGRAETPSGYGRLEPVMNTPQPNMPSLLSIARRCMIDNGLQPDFGDAANRQRDSITQAATSADADVRDLRGLPWCSIDNDNSLDLDQLSVAEAAGAGTVRILVAIADVDAVVKSGSAIDAHAAFNTTSVYTAAAVFPMLPEKLSTNLTSLGLDQEQIGRAHG